MSRRRRLLIVLVGADLAAFAVTRILGYRLGTNTIVRCRQGHLYTTIWIPGGSLKSLRLGWWRYQRCPIGPHWSLVSPVKESDLTPEEIEFAHAHKDARIP